MKVRVVHISTTGRGGAFVAAQRIIEAQNASGKFEATHLLLEPLENNRPEILNISSHKWKNKLLSFILHAVEKIHFIFFEKNKQIRFQFSTGLVGMDIAAHPIVKRADILHIHWINKGFLSFKSIQKLLLLEKEIVWTMHDMWPFTGGCHYAYTCDKFLSKCGNCPYLKTNKTPDLSTKVQIEKRNLFEQKKIHFASPSKWLMNLAKNSYVLKGVSISHIFNCINISEYHPYTSEKKQQLRKKYAVKHDALTVLFIAANASDQRKGIHYLCQALKIIASKNEFKHLDITPVIVGKKSSVFEDLSKLFANTKICGYLQGNEIIDIYNMADVYIIPSLEDNLPNTVVEALSCGVPVIGFNTGGIPEMVKDGVNGFLCSSVSSDAIVEAIEKFVHADKNSLSIHAREFAETHFSPEKIVSSYADIYLQTFK